MTASLAGAATAGVTRAQQLVIGGVIGTIALASWASLVAGLGMDPGLDAGLFEASWLAMVGGMMLPTIAPMLLTFIAMTRPWSARLRWVRVAAFILPYLLLWAGAGLIALAIRSIAQGRPILVAALIAAAGLYQLGGLKQACLRSCRTPLGFMLQHGALARSTTGTVLLGARHAALCFGCCVGLMVAITGAGSIALSWMAALGLLMMVEKTHPSGQRFARATGLGLLALSPLALWLPLMGPPAMLGGVIAFAVLASAALVVRGLPRSTAAV